MDRRFRAAGSYVQSPGAIEGATEHLAALFGERALLVGGETALSTVEDRLVAALDGAGIAVVGIERGVDSATGTDIEDGVGRVGATGADVVVGVGGGTAIDAAKAVSARAGTEFVSVPTVASTDAPASAVSVVYDAEGNLVDAVYRERNPELVLVDTAAIAAAPVRFLRHGIGDAVATRFEAEATERSGGSTIYGDTPTRAGLAAARQCYRELEAHGADALDDVAAGEVTAAVERVVEANVLLSGIGFENGGLAAAHALEGACRNAGAAAPHGVAVAVCTLAQLVLEDHDETGALRDLLVSVGLDATLDDLGVGGRVEEVAAAACERRHVDNEPVDVTPGAVAAALRRADDLLSG